MRGALAGLLVILVAVAGCTNYHYVVRKDAAPLYSDEHRTTIVARMERLSDGYMGHSEPRGDPVRVRYQDRVGWANRADLRIFRYHNDDESRVHAVHRNRREVVLEGKDWPESFKQAVRDGRIENGMTKDMVELAWGPPSGTRSLEGGGERWLFERPSWHVRDDVAWSYSPGASRLYYGFGPWGPSWGYAYDFPSYEPRYFRTYYARTERRTVTFSAAGTVTGWETSGF